jgi:hypothetical protein
VLFTDASLKVMIAFLWLYSYIIISGLFSDFVVTGLSLGSSLTVFLDSSVSSLFFSSTSVVVYIDCSSMCISR